MVFELLSIVSADDTVEIELRNAAGSPSCENIRNIVSFLLKINIPSRIVGWTADLSTESVASMYVRLMIKYDATVGFNCLHNTADRGSMLSHINCMQPHKTLPICQTPGPHSE